jgi:hypothetical protein
MTIMSLQQQVKAETKILQTYSCFIQANIKLQAKKVNKKPFRGSTSLLVAIMGVQSWLSSYVLALSEWLSAIC